VCPRKKKGGGNWNCCSQKGFYSIEVERLNAGELVQCFVEEQSHLVIAFHVEQSWLVRSQNTEGRVKRGVTHHCMMYSTGCKILSIRFTNTQ